MYDLIMTGYVWSLIWLKKEKKKKKKALCQCLLLKEVLSRERKKIFKFFHTSNVKSVSLTREHWTHHSNS